MSNSPYLNEPHERWEAITNDLLQEHPLTLKTIENIVISSWNDVWNTQIGQHPESISLLEINPPATVIGYFLEKIIAKKLSSLYPNEWAGGTSGEHKDLVYIPNPKYSVEIKTSGQQGLKIFGNRSYGQKIENLDRAKKDKSGYYITVNFYGTRLTLIRFGWIDGYDWQAQKSATGQMAGLSSEVYAYKLIPITGDYTLDASVRFLPDVGKILENRCNDAGIFTIRDVLNYPPPLPASLNSVYSKAVSYRRIYGDD